MALSASVQGLSTYNNGVLGNKVVAPRLIVHDRVFPIPQVAPPPSIRSIEAPLIPGPLLFPATCIDSSKRSIKSFYCDGFSLPITVPP